MLVGFAVGVLGGFPWSGIMLSDWLIWQHEAWAEEWQQQLNDKVRISKDATHHKFSEAWKAAIDTNSKVANAMHQPHLSAELMHCCYWQAVCFKASTYRIRNAFTSVTPLVLQAVFYPPPRRGDIKQPKMTIMLYFEHNKKFLVAAFYLHEFMNICCSMCGTLAPCQL